MKGREALGLPDNIIYKTAAFLFAGIGGATAGAMRSTVEYGGKVYKFKVLCSIDNDPVACRNHDQICGEKTSVVMDLFKRWQYKAWHGHEPPETWRETTPWDIWQAFKEQVPFFLFLSPPCKGLSGLLPSDKAASAQYQALNFLTVHGLEMALQACLEYGGAIPAVIQLENVPRITSRGEPLLKQILKMLKKYGYEVSVRSDHNLGTIGGLGQNRVRFLLKARDPKQIPNVIYYPEAKPMKSIGEVLGPLPAPGDTVAGGPMNRLQQLQWKTWMRLALILAGGDWRDLNKVDWKNLRIAHEPRRGAYEVADWNEPSRAVTSTAGPGRSNGVAAVSDPRLHINSEGKTNILRIQSVDEQSSCITGAAGPYQGGASIADPALKESPSRHPAAYRVVRVDEVAPCVTGTRFGSGAIAIADPSLKCSPRADSYGVQHWDQPAKTVIGSADIHASAAAVADPRIPKDNEQGVWVIIAQDGTWHRPLTTYELAMLQNFPTHLPDGRPFQLEGCNDAKAREYIGNAVPPGAEEAMGNVILMAAAEAEAGISFQLSWNPVWVAPGEEQRPTVLH